MFDGSEKWQLNFADALAIYDNRLVHYTEYKCLQVVKNIRQTLKESSGRVLVRDYAAGDLAQERLATKQQQLADHFFVRGDGTRAYYFSQVTTSKSICLPTSFLPCFRESPVIS